LASIGAALGPTFEIVADVGMGEPAGLINQGEGSTKKLEWYGFIRLIIWARPEHPNGAKLCQARENGNVKTCVIPCGDKATGNPVKEGALIDDPDAPYMKGMSTDKGAVCAYFPSACLLVVAAHLHGTNKPLPEAVFNKVREEQLRRIGHGITWLVQEYGSSDEPSMSSSNNKNSSSSSNNSINQSQGLARKKIVTNASDIGATLLLVGDLNFRVESEFTSPEDKEKGGKDFSTIEKYASSDSKEDLAYLLENHDILYKLLRCPSDEIPPILVGCRDAVAETISRKKLLLPPTFTFKQDAPFPRKYKDKRTPSWPDRILFKDLNYFMSPPAAGSVSSIAAEVSAGITGQGQQHQQQHQQQQSGVGRGAAADQQELGKVSIAGLRYCKTLRQVTCSDHEGVVAYFSHGEPSSMDKIWMTFDLVLDQVGLLFSSPTSS
jgi:hypothetical protein